MEEVSKAAAKAAIAAGADGDEVGAIAGEATGAAVVSRGGSREEAARMAAEAAGRSQAGGAHGC